MERPQLTSNVEQKIQSMIELGEQDARVNGQPVESKLYLQLADLYHFHNDYQKETDILTRFANLDCGSQNDLVSIRDRIEQLAGLLEQGSEEQDNANTLELVPELQDKENLSMGSQEEVVKTASHERQSFAEKQLKILALSAACTGRNDNDEIVQLAIVLFEYQASRKKASRLLQSYAARRKPRVPVPAKVVNQFNLGMVERDLPLIDLNRVKELVEQADFIVSHNDAEIERKHLATLISEVAEVPWYSSERDIPWRALGYESSRLTQLSKALGERVPHSCSERANAIRQIVQKTEPHAAHTFLERLYYMQPMTKFYWTPELRAQQVRLSRSERFNAVLIGVFFVAFVATVGSVYFFLS